MTHAQEYIKEVIHQVPLDLVQLSGTEKEWDIVKDIPLPCIKAIHVGCELSSNVLGQIERG